MFTDASFPEDEIATYKQNTLQRLLVSLRQSEFVANQRIDAMIFGENHPYGRFTQKETIEALSQEDIKAFYKKHYGLSGVQIFMAGKVGAEEVAVLEEIFGGVSINKNSEAIVAANITPDSNRIQHFVNDPNSVQAAIRIGKRFPNRLDPDFAPMIVLNTLFGGYFGSRLMSNIREEKGYTYGIYSSLSPFIHDGALTIHTEVGRDVYEDAVKEIYKEMEIICSETIDEEELLLVKNYLLGNMLGDLDGPFSILHRWRTLILNGLTVEHFNKNIGIYKNVTADELSTLAKKHFNKESFFEITVI
jgi:predicted Zn-dependent peptidase